MSISLISIGTPGIILTWRELLFSNNNFTPDNIGWSGGGNISNTLEGVSNTNCAKLTGDFTGLYRNFNITSNGIYRFNIILKTSTTTNLGIVLKNTSTDDTLVTKLIPNNSNYILTTIEFKYALSSIKLGFEIYPGSGTMWINKVNLFQLK